ncbi:hypothetical protein BX600DRAFT_32835 [Xylariales sp. PMI_506]|nr:hypothetical protein BX600DRAFT_32835 [Xylariales sp. PMI_506]
MQRKGHPKAYKGCSTCRIRKIKCDGNKPFCDKCTKTGRSCDGYNQDKQPRFRPNPQWLIPSGYGPEEARALQFFRTRAASSLSGPYDGYFWTNVVLQLSNSEPIIQHAVLAISSLYEDFSCKGRELNQLQVNQFALYHYNIAVRKLRDAQHEPLVLLACLLFICIEVMQDNKAQAIIHCRHGLAILQSIQPTAVWARDHLAPIFQRLTAFPVLFGGYDPGLEQEQPPLRPVPEVLRSMDQANSIAEELLKRTLQLICCGDQYRYGVLVGRDVSSELLAAREQLVLASKAFKRSLDRFGRQLLRQGGACSIYMRIWYSCCELRAEYCWIWGSLALDLGEMAYDRFIPRFRKMNNLIQSLSEMMPHETRPGPTFQFDISYLAITHVIAMKCRDLATRLEALASVKTYGPIKESFWEADKMYQLARRIIEIEHDVTLDEFDQPVGEVAWKHLPLDERRVRNSFFDQDVVLYSKLNGQFVSGNPLGLIMRDCQGDVYLRYEFISVKITNPGEDG